MTDPIRPVFLLSLPRSGSTMTQSVLAAHPGVATASEPWILLPLLATLHEDLSDAAYDHRSAVRAITHFADGLPGGRESYRSRIREFALSCYAGAAGDDASWFVDKTPRYHLVVDDLIDLFPDAVFVFLWRNPLAIVASMMGWYRIGWVPYRHAIDLFDGLANLVAAAQRLDGAQNVVQVSYEALVTDERAWEPLLGALDVPFDRTALDRVSAVGSGGPIGDPLDAYEGVSAASLDKWRDRIDSPVRVAWCRRYLDWIGADRLAVMGYDLADLHAELGAVGRGGAWRAATDVADALRQRVLAWRSGYGSGPWFPGSGGGA